MSDEDDASGYLLYHSIGQYPGKAAALAEAMAGLAAVWGRADDGQWPHLLGLRARFLRRWEGLLNAPAGTLTTVDSVTAGLAALMTALPEDALRGRRVMVSGDCFPSVHFLLSGLAPRLGFALDTVPLRRNAAWVEDEDIAAAWTGDVALAVLTWVSSTSSHRSDVAALAAHGRGQGSLVGADITQGAGLLDFDVTAMGVDFTLSTSLKWVCGTPGAGILHVTQGLASRCRPAIRGWFSQPDPFNWDLGRFDYAPDARRFDTGTPSIMAAAGSLPALDWLVAADRRAILAHNRALSAQLIDGLDALGLALASPRDEARRGGSVMARLPERLEGVEVAVALRAAGCHADTRGRLLRLSPGTVTTAEGIERCLRALAPLL